MVFLEEMVNDIDKRLNSKGLDDLIPNNQLHHCNHSSRLHTLLQQLQIKQLFCCNFQSFVQLKQPVTIACPSFSIVLHLHLLNHYTDCLITKHTASLDHQTLLCHTFLQIFDFAPMNYLHRFRLQSIHR